MSRFKAYILSGSGRGIQGMHLVRERERERVKNQKIFLVMHELVDWHSSLKCKQKLWLAYPGISKTTFITMLFAPNQNVTLNVVDGSQTSWRGHKLFIINIYCLLVVCFDIKYSLKKKTKRFIWIYECSWK